MQSQGNEAYKGWSNIDNDFIALFSLNMEYLFKVY